MDWQKMIKMGMELIKMGCSQEFAMCSECPYFQYCQKGCPSDWVIPFDYPTKEV